MLIAAKSAPVGERAKQGGTLLLTVLGPKVSGAVGTEIVAVSFHRAPCGAEAGIA